MREVPRFDCLLDVVSVVLTCFTLDSPPEGYVSCDMRRHDYLLVALFDGEVRRRVVLAPFFKGASSTKLVEEVWIAKHDSSKLVEIALTGFSGSTLGGESSVGYDSSCSSDLAGLASVCSVSSTVCKYCCWDWLWLVIVVSYCLTPNRCP